MIKRRVIISYGAVLLFIFMLLAINLFSSDGILGFVVKEDNSLKAYSPGFTVSIENYHLNENNLEVEYVLIDRSDKSHELDLSYEVYDGEGQSYVSGAQRVVLGASSRADYNLNIFLEREVPSGAVLLLEARENNLRAISSKSLKFSAVITGEVISNNGPIKITGIFVLFVFILGILFYGAKAVRERSERKRYISSLHEKNFVKLDI